MDFSVVVKYNLFKTAMNVRTLLVICDMRNTINIMEETGPVVLRLFGIILIDKPRDDFCEYVFLLS